MFLFQNGKFHIEGLSFTIHDGYTLDTIDTSEEYQGGMKMVSPDGNIIITVLPIFCGTGSIGIELDAEGHFRDKLVNEADSFQTIIPAAPIRRRILQDTAPHISAKETGIPRISSTMKNCMTYRSRRTN